MYNSSATEAVTLNPSRTFQESLRAASVPARNGYTAVSIQDYERISSRRDEFLNFLLLPNPEGIPAIEYAGLRVA
ncbi:MAG: nuclease PIN [Rothia sp. (in: high G+C Gram-positive bacteria)]|uniref:nuclease PIN n=1 Tax=Rothia sp. (in: high G+C Gram-positive bacteria) TaxID=1885016 RepID=UPI0026DF63CC|nr:nuclease PIN [Rothia sp. (in: high G+C Gram-positive bacteria)]MDO5750232.1 nuclease PIN [Rothia sp. (in: high G+C Gram-positive bacteria)]